MIKTYSINFGYDIVHIFKDIFVSFVFVGNEEEVEDSKVNHKDIEAYTYSEILLHHNDVEKTKTIVISTSLNDYKYILDHLQEFNIALVLYDEKADYKLREPYRSISHIYHPLDIEKVQKDVNTLVIGEGIKGDYNIKDPIAGKTFPNIGYIFTYYDGNFDGYFTSESPCVMVHLDYKYVNRKGYLKSYYDYILKNGMNEYSEFYKYFDPNLIKVLSYLSTPIRKQDIDLIYLIQNYKGLNNDVRSLYFKESSFSLGIERGKDRDVKEYDKALLKVFNTRIAKLENRVRYVLNGTSVYSSNIDNKNISVIKMKGDIIVLGLGYD
jgi:hypothetical protein